MTQDKRKGGLGRGLAALIPTGDQKPHLGDSAADILMGGGGKHGAKPAGTTADLPAIHRTNSATATTTPGEVKEEGSDSFGAVYQEIPIALVSPNPKQPRHVFDEEALDELVHSIKEFGLMQPIVVRPKPGKNKGYEIIMGERRWRASTKAGLERIPAIIRNTDDGDMLRDALLENIHRVQLNPLEEAAAYQQLLEEFGVTQGQLAEKIGRSRPVISNMIRLLELPTAVQRKVAAGVLSAGHARALLGLKQGPKEQEKLAGRIIAEGMSVRATEEAVTLLNRDEREKELNPLVKKEPKPLPVAVNKKVEGLADKLETRVTVAMGTKKGKLTIEFAGREDFDRIMEILGK